MTTIDTTPDNIADTDRPWPAWMTFYTAWLLPATTAKRIKNISLVWAFVIHLIAALLTILLIMFLVACDETYKHPVAIYVWPEFVDVIQATSRELSRAPREILYAICVLIILIELSFIALALLIAPWGARDEPLRASFTHALRRTWLHTTHALPAILLVGILFVSINHAKWSHRMKYQNVWNRYLKTRPWYVKHDEEIIINVGFAASAWILWALFRGVGTQRTIKPIERPPMCEQCGYNLIVTPMESRCPECGEPVIHSLGPEARRGTWWQQRHIIGRWRAWWRCNVDGLIRTPRLGKQIRLQAHVTDHRIYLVMNLMLIFFIGAIGIMLCYYTDTGRNPLKENDFLLIAPGTGYITALVALVSVLIAAGFCGIRYRLQDKRNLICGSIQMACYSSGYLVLWAMLSSFVGFMVFFWKDKFMQLENITIIEREILMFFAWFLPNLLLFLGYILLVYQGTAGTRYANR
ncbi:MAG: hypothetical protein ACYTF1_05030 [Planctomycetota bacterium]